MDVFGLLRDPHGRALSTSNHERKAKYLLNQEYVPANFDGLIIGASASVSWAPAYLTGYHFYNESLEGGNATEERILVEHAMKKGHFKVALVGLHPRITEYHELGDGLDKATPAEALGSLNSFGIEADVLLTRLTHRHRAFSPDGSHDMPVHVPTSLKPGEPTTEIWQDPQSLADYKALISELQQTGTRVVYVIYPTLAEFHDYNAAVMQQYREEILKQLPPAPVVDFDGPADAAFRATRSNYIDDIHLTPQGSITLTRMIDQRMHEVLHDR